MSVSACGYVQKNQRFTLRVNLFVLYGHYRRLPFWVLHPYNFFFLLFFLFRSTMPNKSYTFTLNRAHKIVERLKTHASELVKEAELLASPLSVRSQEEAGSQKRAADNALNALINLEAYTTVLATIHTLRQAIATANHTSGVDNLLALQNKQTQILSAYKRVLDSVAPASSVGWDQIPAVANEYTRYSLETLNADQLSAIREVISSTQMKLHATSDSVSDANRTSITVEISEEHARIAGLAT